MNNELTSDDWNYLRALVEARLRDTRNTISCMGKAAMIQLEMSGLAGLLQRVIAAMPDPDVGHDPNCPLEHLGPCTHPPIGGDK